jgi:hypothetical protein
MIFIIGEDLVKKMFYSKYNLKKKIKNFLLLFEEEEENACYSCN